MQENQAERRNYYLLVIANSVSAVFGGLSVPFFLLFFFEFGGSASVYDSFMSCKRL